MAGQNGTFKWKKHHREVLLILFSEFGHDYKTWVPIFSHVFRDDIRSYRIPDGQMKCSTLRSQYAEKNRAIERGSGAWLDVPDEPRDAHEAAARAVLRQRVEMAIRTAESIGSPAGDAHNSDVASEASTDELSVLPEIVHPRRAATPLDVRNASKTVTRQTTRQNLPSPPVSEEASVATSATPIAPTPVTRRPRRTANHNPEAEFAQKTSTRVTKATRPAKSQKRQDSTKKAFFTYDGALIQAAAKTIAKAQEPLKKISDAVAFHDTGCLFRCWKDEGDSWKGHIQTESNAGPRLNSVDGFWSRDWFDQPIFPSAHMCPGSINVNLLQIKRHVERTNEIPGPWISTTNRLVWIFRHVNRRILQGERGLHISIMNPENIADRGPFHLLPYQQEINRRFQPYKKDESRYVGCFEHLVWGVIPRKAMIHTVDVEELLRCIMADAHMTKAFRAHCLDGRFKESRNALIQTRYPLEADTVIAISKMCKLFGLTPDSPFEVLSHFVYECISGWRHMDDDSYRDPSEWKDLACTFSNHLCQDTIPSPDDERDVKRAFLNGLYWSCGGGNQNNPKFTREGQEKVERGAAKRGLDLDSRIAMLDCESRHVRDRMYSLEMEQTKVVEERLAALDLAKLGYFGTEDSEPVNTVLARRNDLLLAGEDEPEAQAREATVVM